MAPTLHLGAPLQYMRSDSCRGTRWIDYDVTVTDTVRGRVWDTEIGRLSPLVDRFDLSGTYRHDSGVTLSYASFTPASAGEKSPLLIWLHGGGEGGHDPAVPLLANRAAHYASDEIQAIFDGAYVLVPQCPGAWMHNAEGVMTLGREGDVYNVPLMALIEEYVAAHPGIDTNRIYVGGCSNGGYMSLKLLLLHPDYFAAGFIAALAYDPQYITDEQIRTIAHLPIWFVHSQDDQTTRPEKMVLPVYERLTAAGARTCTCPTTTTPASSAVRISITTATRPGSTCTPTSAGGTATEASSRWMDGPSPSSSGWLPRAGPGPAPEAPGVRPESRSGGAASTTPSRAQSTASRERYSPINMSCDQTVCDGWRVRL